MRANAAHDRCFAIGLRSGADAGLVGGIARASGWGADFVIAQDGLSAKVIAQVEGSFAGALTCAALEAAAHDDIELASFPVPAVSAAVEQALFAFSKTLVSADPVPFRNNFIVDRLDKVVAPSETAIGAPALRALFAFETINLLSSDDRRPQRSTIVELSIATRVFWSEAAFIGISNKIFDAACEKPLE
jgi:hypothetical protein